MIENQNRGDKTMMIIAAIAIAGSAAYLIILNALNALMKACGKSELGIIGQCIVGAVVIATSITTKTVWVIFLGAILLYALIIFWNYDNPAIWTDSKKKTKASR